jgi:hypothetical protein
VTPGETSAPAAEFKDRKTWMVVFGILQILLGAFCALMVPVMAISMVAAPTLDTGSENHMTMGALISSTLFYVFLAVWFIWMGIGSINTRRWARALILVTSCLWLVGGLIGFFFVVVYMPAMFDQMAMNGEIPPEIAVAVKYMTLGFVTVLYIVIPGVLAFFYGTKNVKTTCDLRDPKISWTDKCPLSVLGLCFAFGLGIISMVGVLFNDSVFPFFGHILSGVPGAAVVLAVIGIKVYVCRGLYKLKLKAWRAGVLLVTLGSVSAIITFMNTDLAEFYEKMNYTPEQLELMERYKFLQGSDMVVYFALFMLVFLAFLMYTRRFFIADTDGE